MDSNFLSAESITNVVKDYQRLLVELERKDPAISEEDFFKKYKQIKISVSSQDAFVLAMDDSHFIYAAKICRSIVNLLRHMEGYPNLYNAYCAFNSHYLGDRFFELIALRNEITLYELVDTLLTIYRFSNEVIIMTNGSVSTSDFFETKRQLDIFFQDDFFDGFKDLRSQYSYIKEIMVFRYLTFRYEKIDFSDLGKIRFDKILSIDFDLLKDLDVVKINKQLEKGDYLFGKKDEAESLIDMKLEVLKAHEDKINNYTTAYNFVGLSNGFKTLGEEKQKQLNNEKRIMSMYGLSLIIVPLALIYFSLSGGLVSSASLGLALPFLSLELILLYFYRVKLLEVRSLSAQILQVGYRLSLCQFIQSYAEYSQGIHEKSPGLLEKFESVIFSPIVANENEIPSTFDGVNQIAELIGKIKK